jgi:hypothetical protein
VLSSVVFSLAAVALPALAQFPDVLSESECPGCGARFASFAGLWSSPLTAAAEPGWALEDFFCVAACTVEGRAAARGLLADAETAHRSALELYPDAFAANVRSVGRHSARASGPLATGRLPGFSCDHPGLAAQVVSPLPLQIETEAERVVLRYEESGAERSIPLDGDTRSHGDRTSFGVSKGRFERGVLVVETSGIPAGRLSDWLGGLPHSDALHALERYSVSADGQWLVLELTLEDPATLAKPLVVTKRWRRTPQEHLARHVCDVMSAGLSGVFAEYLDPRIIDARRSTRQGAAHSSGLIGCVQKTPPSVIVSLPNLSVARTSNSYIRFGSRNCFGTRRVVSAAGRSTSSTVLVAPGGKGSWTTAATTTW